MARIQSFRGELLPKSRARNWIQPHLDCSSRRSLESKGVVAQREGLPNSSSDPGPCAINDLGYVATEPGKGMLRSLLPLSKHCVDVSKCFSTSLRTEVNRSTRHNCILPCPAPYWVTSRLVLPCPSFGCHLTHVNSLHCEFFDCLLFI